MIPIPGLEDVKIKWVLLEKEGFLLFGFLLYTNSDRALVDYMKDGLFDLDFLSGDKCAIFVIESPSKEWIARTQKSGHTWWKIYGNQLITRRTAETTNFQAKKHSIFPIIQKIIIENNQDCMIAIGDGNHININQLLEPDIDLLYDRSEALRVARFFGLQAKDVPCLIFFKDLDSHIIWNSPLGNLQSQNEVKLFFRQFFESSEFSALMMNQGVRNGTR